jgi:GTP cyclohydrolase I
MSRFLEVLGEQEGPLNRSVIQELLKKLKARLRSQCARLEVKFQIFAEKAAPVTEKVGYMAYECGFEAHTDSIDGFHMLLQCPISTVCPCSKEISDYGAHNQRGLVSVKVNPTGELGFEQLIQAIEASGSAPLYPVLKREDEKFVTELAYNNPRFVEDVVREVAGRFDQIEAIHSYQIEVENYESIHDHNAYAFIERTK